MRACAKTKDIFFYLKSGNWKEVSRLIKSFDRLVFESTFMPFLCPIIGHRKVIYDFIDYVYSNEIVCKRCHRYIKSKPIVYNERLSDNDNKLVYFIQITMRAKVAIYFEEKHIKLSWKQNGADGYSMTEMSIIRRLKKDVKDYLGERLLEFSFDRGMQSVHFKYTK
jgi:hypothetical protein